MKRIAILQSDYIPWKGYFDIINSVDEFIIYDDVQYTRRDWRNRNLIKTRTGLLWLTIPVSTKGRYDQKISEAVVNGRNWADKHFDSICHNYRSAPYFKEYEGLFRDGYQKAKDCHLLSQINMVFLCLVNSILGIKTNIHSSSEFIVGGEKNERLIEICKQAGATEYLSGPAAKEYLDISLFKKNGIRVLWADYSGYPEYKQLYPPFDHNVSIVDLIFNTGANARSFMKSFNGTFINHSGI